VVEHRLVVVLAGDHDELVPGAGVDDSFVVDLDLRVFGVDGWKGVTDAVHMSPSVAATSDRNELACLLVVVGRDELDQGCWGDPALRKVTTYLRSRPHLFLRMVSPSPTWTAPSARVVPMNTR